MIRFTAFEHLGVAVAAMSDKSDGDLSGDPESENERTLRKRLGLGRTVPRRLQQMHGAVIAVAQSANGGVLPAADGLITSGKGVPLFIRIADCVPVFLYDPITQAAGLLHAGWRGTLANITGAGVECLTARFGARPESLHALVGPSAGPCCYEVSDELAEEFRNAGLAAKGRMADLWESNSRQLERAGLDPARIQTAGICTICDGRFHSRRADPQSGHNAAILMI